MIKLKCCIYLLSGNYFNVSMFVFLSSIDHNLFWLINSHHSYFFDCFFSIVTYLGNGWVVAPVLLAIVVKKIPRKKLFPFIVFSTIFMVGSALINTQIKQSINRPRPMAFFGNETNQIRLAQPRASQAPYAVHVVGERMCCNSFPSGHANTAFSAATLVALRFGGVFWWAYLPAGIVGYSRIYMGAHFPSDVGAGALLGVVVLWIGLRMYYWFDRRGTVRHDKQ